MVAIPTMQIFLLKGSCFSIKLGRSTTMLSKYLASGYTACGLLCYFVFNGTLPERFDLRKKKEAYQWNKPKILLSLREKSALHCLSGFEFKHVLEGFAGKLHGEEACGSELADLIPSLGKA